MAQVEFAGLEAATVVVRLGKLNTFDRKVRAITIENSDVMCSHFSEYIYILKCTCKIKAETYVIIFCSNPPAAVASQHTL